jgi:hypothetical protein
MRRRATLRRPARVPMVCIELRQTKAHGPPARPAGEPGNEVAEVSDQTPAWS